jgi:predicted CXXCH cytochrome family protein
MEFLPTVECRRRRRRRLSIGWAFIGIAAVTLLLVTACGTVERRFAAPPQIEGATFVGSSVCSDCHAQISDRFRSNPHARFHKDDPQWREMSGCESCHGPGSLHVAKPGRQLIFNPGKNPAACFNCHIDVEAEFRLPSHHPVTEARMNCVECHDPHGMDMRKSATGLAMARLNEGCANCHQEQSRPFVFEHEALREGCTSCHSPHGSVNARLLVARDSNLCLRCHAQLQTVTGAIVIGKVDHTSHLKLGTCYSAGCHQAVHGSNVHPKLRY